jgi:hypothetical protein
LISKFRHFSYKFRFRYLVPKCSHLSLCRFNCGKLSMACFVCLTSFSGKKTSAKIL